MRFFCVRLRAIRESKKLTQSQVGQALGMTDRQYRFYESGAHEPGMSKLVALADYFDVSLDYLVGRSDDPVRR